MATAEVPDRTAGYHLSTVLRLVLLAGLAAVAYLLLSAGAAHADGKPVVPDLEDVAAGLTPTVHSTAQDAGHRRNGNPGARQDRPVRAGKSAVAPVRAVKSAVVPVRAVKSAVVPVRAVKSAVAPVRAVKSAVAPVRGVKSAVAPVRARKFPVASVRTVQAHGVSRAGKAVRTTIGHVTKPVTTTLRPVVAPLTPTLRTVTTPLTATLQPVTTPLTATLQPVTTPLTATFDRVAPALSGPMAKAVQAVTAAPAPRPVVTHSLSRAVLTDSVSRPVPSATPAPPFSGTPAQAATVVANLPASVLPASDLPAAAHQATADQVADAAGEHDHTARPLHAQFSKSSGDRDAPGSEPPPAPAPDPVYLALLSSSGAPGADSAPANWATTSAAWLPTPAPAGTAPIDSNYRRGRRVGCAPLPG